MGDKKGGKGRKIGSNVDYCKLYSAADLWAKNQKRRIRRHLLSHPNDAQAIKAYEKAYGNASDIRVMVKGKATDRLINAHARHKVKWRANRDRIASLENARAIRRTERRIAREKQVAAPTPEVTVPSAA